MLKSDLFSDRSWCHFVFFDKNGTCLIDQIFNGVQGISVMAGSLMMLMKLSLCLEQLCR